MYEIDKNTQSTATLNHFDVEGDILLTSPGKTKQKKKKAKTKVRSISWRCDLNCSIDFEMVILNIHPRAS